jgi:hypothetical protein
VRNQRGSWTCSDENHQLRLLSLQNVQAFAAEVRTSISITRHSDRPPRAANSTGRCNTSAVGGSELQLALIQPTHAKAALHEARHPLST